MEVTTFSALVIIASLIGVEEPPIINQTQLIKVPEGSNLTLQCRTNPEVNLENFTLDWKRNVSNHVVYSRRHGKDHPHPQMERYRNRAELIKEDLTRGWMTLLIPRVQESDSGRFRCFIPKLNANFVFNIVVKKDQEMRTKREDFTTTTSPVGAMSLGVTDAAEKRSYWSTLSSVLLLLCVLIGVVSKTGICKKESRRRADEENQNEVEPLRTGDEDGGKDKEDGGNDEEDGGKDKDITAANGLRDVQHG